MTSRPCLLRAGSRIGAVQDRDVVVNCFFFVCRKSLDCFLEHNVYYGPIPLYACIITNS